MSDPEVLEELINRAREAKYKLARLSDTAHVHGRLFLELGKALESGGSLPNDFPFEHCDVAEARRILEELPRLRSDLVNLESRIKRRTSLE